MADAVVPDDEVYSTAVAMARKFAAGPPLALAAAKRAIDEGLELSDRRGSRAGDPAVRRAVRHRGPEDRHALVPRERPGQGGLHRPLSPCPPVVQRFTTRSCASDRPSAPRVPPQSRRRPVGAIRALGRPGTTIRRTRATKHPAHRGRGRDGGTHPHRLRLGATAAPVERRERLGRRHGDLGRRPRRHGRPGQGRARRRARSTSSRCPPDWANYGEMLKTFGDKYGIKINSANPDGSSQDELNAVTSQKGQDRAPDVLDVGTSFAKQAAAQNLLAPYKVATWDDIPDNQKDADGLWYNDYGGFISIGCNATVGREVPDHDGRAARPAVQGPGRAQRQPDAGGRRVQRRLGGGAVQRRQPRRHRPGHRLLQEGQGRRQLQPRRVHAGHGAERRDPDLASTGTT